MFPAVGGQLTADCPVKKEGKRIMAKAAAPKKPLSRRPLDEIPQEVN
jgi:hypothetical protein